ncbi:hypothetical protein HD554DRAFT_242793 [Boletus coccyginus]|nr:hypothetical protein HD554DRAFT_242793 [Boletus coccyginus]
MEFFISLCMYMLFFITITLLDNSLTISNTWQLFLILLSYTTICPIMPRFIISMRELYDRNLHGAGQQGIDTGFGMLSQPIASQSMAVSAISFVEVATGQGQGQEGDAEAIQLEEMGDSTYQVVEGGHVDNSESEMVQAEVLGDGTHHV